MTIEEMKQQLDFLSEKIDMINANLQFNITTFLAVLALAIAIVGVALVLLVKNIVNKRVEEQLDKKIEEIKKSIIEGLKKEEFICELTIFDSWKLIQPIIMHKYQEGYIKITGSVIFDGEKEGRYNIMSVIPYGFRPSEEMKFLAMNGGLNGECVILKDGCIVFKKGNINDIIQFNVIYKQEDIK